MLIKDNVLSPVIMVQWNIAGYFRLKVTIRLQIYPIFHFHPGRERFL